MLNAMYLIQTFQEPSIILSLYHMETDQFSVQEMKKYRKMARASPSRMLTSRRKSEPHFYIISNFGSGISSIQ